MRKFWGVAYVAAVATVMSGCNLKKSADAVAEAGVVAVAASDSGSAAPESRPLPAAKNAADIARFASETKLDNEPAKLVAPMTIVRSGPKMGSQVALLRAGHDVFKVAELSDAVLVVFEQPPGSTSYTMGWIGKEAFTARASSDVAGRDGGVTDAGVRDGGGADSGTVAVARSADAGVSSACATGTEAVVVATGSLCLTKCKSDADCKGKGICATASNPAGKAARVCLPK